jgi:outer membrane protein
MYFIRMKRIFILLVYIILFSGGYAQQKQWTLEECIRYAKEHNLSVKIQQFNVDLSRANLTQSKGTMLPFISGYASHSYNYGQTVDRFTNQFATDMVRSNNFYLSANVTLFNGFQLLNSVKRSQYELKASQYDLQVMENEISLTIATAFLQILYATEMVENARIQYELTLKQVDRTKKMLDAGAVANTILLNLEAQAASEEYQLTSMETQLEMALLTLSQLLDLPTHSDFRISVPAIDISEPAMPLSSEYISEYALKHQPEIMSAEMRMESARKSYAVAKGGYSPSLTFGASLGTGYSGARQNITGMNYLGMDTVGITTGSPPDFVLAPVFQYLYEPVSFRDQIDQNFNRTIGFNLNIPIFSGLQNSTNVSRSKINMYIAETNLQQVKMNVRKTIQQAHLDAISALKRYLAAVKQTEATGAAFRLAEERFELNDMTLLEYQDAKTRLTQSESEMLQAKYEYVFTMKVLDFYLGNEIKLQ